MAGSAGEGKKEYIKIKKLGKTISETATMMNHLNIYISLPIFILLAHF